MNNILLITIQISLLVLIVLAVAIYRAVTKPIGKLSATVSGKDLAVVFDRNNGSR